MFSMECKGIHHVIGTENIANIMRVPLDTDVNIPVLQMCSVDVIQAETSSKLQ